MSIHAAFARMLASRLVALASMIASFALLGRLLTPAAFGHFALAMAVFALAETISGFGLRNFLVRERELDAETAGRAVGLAIVLSALAGGALLLTAWALGGWAIHPGSAAALTILAPALLFAAVGGVAESLLQRELDFRLLSATGVARALVEGGVAVVLAWMGWGAAALAGGVLASRAVTAGLVLGLGGHARALRPRFGGWRRFGGFGLRLVATDLLPNGAGLALNAALTGSLGAATLGLYNRAEAIRAMLDRTVLEGIKPVVLPVIARALKAGWSPADIHHRKIDYLAAICWPAFGLIALMADPIVAVLLGPGWEEAVPAVRILALTGLGIPATKMSVKFFVATDLLDVYLHIAATQQALRVALAACGALISLEAFCAALAVAMAVRAAMLLRAVHVRFGPGRPGHAAILGRAGAASAGALAGPCALLLWGTPTGSAATLALSLPLAGLGWLGALALTRHALLTEARTALTPMLRRFRGRRAAQV